MTPPGGCTSGRASATPARVSRSGTRRPRWPCSSAIWPPEPSGTADTLGMMASLRAFPVLYARDVELVAGFYATLGFVEHFRLPGADGAAGFIPLRREGGAELAGTTEDSPPMLGGAAPGPGPRHERFVDVEDADAALGEAPAAGGRVLKEAADMRWGERVGFVGDPESNVVSLAAPVSAA